MYLPQLVRMALLQLNVTASVEEITDNSMQSSTLFLFYPTGKMLTDISSQIFLIQSLCITQKIDKVFHGYKYDTSMMLDFGSTIVIIILVKSIPGPRSASVTRRKILSRSKKEGVDLILYASFKFMIHITMFQINKKFLIIIPVGHNYF